MDLSQSLFLALVLAVAGERLAEMVVSRRNAAWAFSRGGVESGRGHFPVMVALHTSFLAACVLEAVLTDRTFVAWLGWPMLACALLAQGLRWWCISTLGRQWNTRVIVLPGASLVSGGPYRWLRHPNYLAVVVEGAALPLVHTAWATALGFNVLNAALLTVRIRVEERALRRGRGATPGPRPA